MNQDLKQSLKHTFLGRIYVFLRQSLRFRLLETWLKGICRFGFRPRCTIYFGPDEIRLHSEVLRITLMNRYRVTKKKECADLSVYWAFGSSYVPDSKEEDFHVNNNCHDITKRNVDAVHQQVFGYSLGVDPRTYEGRAIFKSDDNATQDATFIDLPINEPDPLFVFQRIVDNSVDEKTNEDICLPIVNGTIPTAHLVYRPVDTQIGGRIMGDTRLVQAEQVLSRSEMIEVVRFCSEIGLDFGELDCARDRSDGRLYILDANRANGAYVMPGEMTTRRAYWKHLELIADAFDREFVQPVLAAKGGSQNKRL